MFNQDELFVASMKEATIRNQQIRELQRTRTWLFVLMLVFVAIAYFYESVHFYFIAAINAMVFMKTDQDIKFLLLVRALKEDEHDS
jgi:hypothetical protein